MDSLTKPQLKAGMASEMEALFDRLWPIMRSITGEGVRRTGAILGELLPLETREVRSGAQVLDWTVPPEWVFRRAYIVGPDGKRRFDAAENNLLVVNYSAPFRGRLSRAALDAHLHSLPKVPDAIPYVTSYYKKTWGFCVTQKERDALPDGDYDVVVDTALKDDGSLVYFEAVLPGEETAEILISVNICHPSLANNELSGPILAAFLHRNIAAWPKRRHTFRFVFVPETIGAIAFLDRHGEHLRKNLSGGYVLTCVGDAGPIHYKRSRRGNTVSDRAAATVLRRIDQPRPVIADFTPWGSDERQYCSPGFDLPVGTLMRAVPGQYAEYHTSHDNKDAVSFAAMAETLSTLEAMCLALDRNATYRNLKPYGEPKLDKYGLYPVQGGLIDQPDWLFALRWMLSLSDGKADLIAISERSGVPVALLDDIAQRCVEANLLERVL